MLVIPAIDIQNGQVVRLRQGKFDDVTVYSEDPVATAKHWQDKGAQILHVVDLDGARKEHLQNAETIVHIARNLKIPVQTGGGIRELKDIDFLLSGGVTRVVLGTKATQDRGFLSEILTQFKGRVMVSIDCAKGRVTQKGWTKTCELNAIDFARELESLGLEYLIYTDIARDGMLTGPNIQALRELLQEISIPIIASGGISELEDLAALKKLEPEGLMGAIVGKALYENRFDLKDAIDLCLQRG